MAARTWPRRCTSGTCAPAIIGDAIARVLRFAGHDVILQNHIGDWGTQFGMLLEHLIDTGWDRARTTRSRTLNVLYQDAKARFDAEPEFAERSRRRVVKLQARRRGEPRVLATA